MTVAIVTKHQLINLDPFTGAIVSRVNHEVDLKTHRFIMIKSANDISSLIAVPKSSYPDKVEYSASLVGLTHADIKPLFYTQIDEKNSRMDGYTIELKSLIAKKVWTISLGKD